MSHSTAALTVRVAQRRAESEGIVSFDLVSPDGQDLPGFDPGAHIDVHIPGGPVRQYSLCNPPWERHRYQIAVLRDPASRGGSARMHDAVREGSLLEISAPRNHFALAQGSVTHLLLAGGIGITPLLCMAEHLNRQGTPFRLYYCARTRARAAFLEQIAASPWADRAQFHFDDGDGAGPLDFGVLLNSPRPDVHLYVCGPQGFMNVVLDTARAAGWPDERLHYEYFAGVTPTVSEDDASFEVRLAKSGRVVKVPADKTVTQALAEAGVTIEVSCQQGVCGTCLTRVLEGEPDHRDLYFTSEERAQGDQFLPCCSRSKSKTLVLDL